MKKAFFPLLQPHFYALRAQVGFQIRDLHRLCVKNSGGQPCIYALVAEKLGKKESFRKMNEEAFLAGTILAKQRKGTP